MGRPLLAVLLLAALPACTSLSQSGLITPAAPAQERLGTGAHVIGVLSFTEPGNLAGGVPEASYQAARLAATGLAKSPVSIEIRNATADGARAAALALAEVGVRIAVLPADARSVSQAATTLAGKGVPSLSLARTGDSGKNLYGAGFDPAEETAALAADIAARGIAKVALVTMAGEPSRLWAGAAAKALTAKGIAVTPVDAGDFERAQRTLAALPDIGGVVFATTPEVAASLALVLRADPARAALVLFGNAEWALAMPVPPALKGALYAAPAGNALRDYARRFAAASGQRPTLASALVYDLVIMSAALQASVPGTPYDRATLTSTDGFRGFSGAFAFAPSGLVLARQYAITVLD